MRHVAPFSAIAIVVVGLAACRENTVQPLPPRLQATISDGAHFGNTHFFFLPPLVPNPLGLATGTFNPRLAPLVQVCRLASNPLLGPTDCSDLNSDGKPDLVFGPARMSLDATNQQYTLNWDTKSSVLDPVAFYRIFVLGAVGSVPLGFIDVDPVLGGMKNVKTGEVVVFQDGRTLPIKVRIEDGAFGSTNASDHVEQVVPAVLPPTGFDVTTNTGFAGAHFTTGWLPPGFDQVVVIIERISPNCLNTPFEQLEGCYRFRTDPDLHGLGPDGTDLLFAIPVVAGVCFQYPGDIGHGNEHPFELLRSEEITVEGGVRVTPAVPLLDEQPAPFLRCDGFGATPPSIGAAFRSRRIGDIAKAGLYAVTHAIGRIVEPKALHAIDFGAGGGTNEFSRFGYARHASMTVTAGAGAVAPAGSSVQASVHIDNLHHGVVSNAAGVPVTFTATAGGTVVESQPVSTDVNGNASVHWRLALGPNTLQVTASALGSPATLLATGTPVTNATIDFETYPGGAATCVNCVLTNDYSSQGVVFSFTPLAGVAACASFTNAQLFLSSTVYDPVGGDANHSVTSAGLPAGGFCSGTVSMNFGSLPDTIRFQLRGNNDIALFPVAAFDGNGNAIPASAIDRSNVSTFTSVSGFTFRQETITIINTPGTISRIDLGMNGFITLVDNLIILYPTPIP